MLIETIVVLVVLLIIVGLLLYALDRATFPGPTGAMIKMVLVVGIVLIAVVYLVQRFLT